MNLGPVFSQLMQMGLDSFNAGKLPAAAKGAFYSLFTLVLFMATGYLSNIDTAIHEMSKSLAQLNVAVAANIETTSWHSKEIQRQGQEIARLRRCIAGLQKEIRKTTCRQASTL